MTNDGRGWHGDSQGHSQAGSQSSGNPNAAENLDEQARSKGGKVSSGNFRNNPDKAKEAGREGGSK